MNSAGCHKKSPMHSDAASFCKENLIDVVDAEAALSRTTQKSP